ncbi:hypothetical protein SCLARK_001278 [Spiroplasma clarkii]|uniref:HTH rpiR-type domain-containing protein n=1 Tax=Spiroplasma clarkii TaxID=2139 RepID=A0A1Y0L274_9MOLU|nr:MurR/RpiR family transcriptional regulator [Spiroplasma clarkii]ARU91818.1 hypothetical protein SCLARK_001278 [Spiroplasma clarkii]ATX71182.1 hypothetical protein SCLAR_v1c08740 [Spiroplasma clarkii]
MDEKVSLLYKIEEIKKNGQNPVYKSIAGAVLLNLPRIGELKVSTIAKTAQVSTSSVTRFSQMLGASGFKELAFSLVWERDLQTKNYRSEIVENVSNISHKLPEVEKLFVSKLWTANRSDCKSICNIASVLKQNKVVFLFGTGEYAQLLQIFKNDLMWEDKTIIFSSDLDNQVHYSKNISKNDVAFFVDDAMIGNEFLEILKNVQAKTNKICMLTFNSRIFEPNIYWLNLLAISGKNKVAKLAFVILVLKTIIALMGGEKLNV